MLVSSIPASSVTTFPQRTNPAVPVRHFGLSLCIITLNLVRWCCVKSDSESIKFSTSAVLNYWFVFQALLLSSFNAFYSLSHVGVIVVFNKNCLKMWENPSQTCQI